MSAMLDLLQCEACRGKGRVHGIFHRMECVGCNGGGLVTAAGEALPYRPLVEQLRLRLAAAEARQHQAGCGGPGEDYQGMNNRHRAGGGNWTGD